MFARNIHYLKNAKRIKKLYPNLNSYSAVLGYWKLWLCYRLYYKPLGIQAAKVRFMGMSVSTPSIKHLLIIIKEVFLEYCYATDAKRSDPVIYDLGGNIGMATLFFKKVYPECSVDIFEPNPDTLEHLEANIKNNSLEKVTVHAAAVGDKDGELGIFISGNASSSGAASIIKSGERMQEINVPCVKISGLLDKPVDIMKIDVECSENMIVEDLYNTGKLKLIKTIVAEYHHNVPGHDAKLGRMLTQLEDAGFKYHLTGGARIPVKGDDAQIMMLHTTQNQ